MKLRWSHAVLLVRDKEKMIDFYTRVLGFTVTDRGPVEGAGPEVVFMSQVPEEHHQIAMVGAREDEMPSNTVHHFAFRVESFEEMKALSETLQPMEGIEVAPLCHGNALSIYFNDPEGNGLEVFWDTPWHVTQPVVRPWDISMDRQQALDWVQETFKAAPGFRPANEFRQEQEATFA